MDVELRGITKRFGPVVANDNVNLTIRGGEVLGLLGENGAGKSTMMNILSGLYSPDEGEVLIDGKPVVFEGPGDGIEAGIGMVHQHFMLVPVFTVAENVVLGVEPTGRLGYLDLKKARAQVDEINKKYGLHVPAGHADDGHLLLLGGEGKYNTRSACVLALSLATLTWAPRQLPPLPHAVPHGLHGCFQPVDGPMSA